MSNVCSKCGNEISEGAAFCTECGTPVSNTKKSKKKLTDVIKKDKKTKESEVEVPVMTEAGTVSMQDTEEADTLKSSEEVSTNEPVAKKTPISENVFREKPVEKISKPLKTVFFFLLIVLYRIPILGLIIAAVVSSSAKNENLANYSKATFIWKIALLIVLFVGLIVVLILVKKAGLTMSGYIGAIKSAIMAFAPDKVGAV